MIQNSFLSRIVDKWGIFRARWFEIRIQRYSRIHR